MADITKRINYYDHQFLREDDMNLQQEYHMDRHRRHNRLQHTWGVADGLVVEFVGGASLVTVRPGTAIDAEGREIVLATDDPVELSGVTSGQDVYITISYKEELSDPTTETGAAGDTRWDEAPLIEASVGLPTNPELKLVLALVTRTGTAVTAVDNEIRTRAGVVGGDLEVTSMTMTDPGVIPTQWPSMSLDSAERAKVTGSLRISQDLIVDGTITGDIAVGSVQAADLVNDAVTSAKLKEADGTSGQNTAAGSGVKTNHIQNDAITAVKIAAGAVGNSELASNSVTADKIADGTVIATELGNNAVISAKLAEADNTTGQNTETGRGVKTNHIQNDAITAAKIAASAVGNSEISNGVVTQTKLDTTTNNKINNALPKSGGSVTGSIYSSGQIQVTRTTASTATYYGYFTTITANSTGQARGMYTNATGAGTGAKYGLLSYASGSGTKHGIYSHVTGTGTKYAAYFSANTASGDDTYTYGIRNSASSSGNSYVYGISSSAGGTGTGIKYGINASTSGAGTKYAGYFSSDSGTGITNVTHGIYTRATGAGTGAKYGVYGYTSGGGEKFGGRFYSTTPSGVNSTTYGNYSYAITSGNGVTYGCYGYGRSGGTGATYGVRGYAYTTGSGVRYGVYGSTGGAGTGSRYAGYFSGNVHVSGTLSKSAGTFLIDHPDDAKNKTLRHNFVESPENLCLYRGKVKLDAKGVGKVEMPDYFTSLTSEEDATVTLTSIGKKPFLVSYEWNKKYTTFTVYGEANEEVSYLVLSDRDDPTIRVLRRPVVEEKGGDNFEKGRYLFPEAYDEPPEKGVDPVFEESLSDEEIQAFKDVEKARQAEETAQEKLRVEMEEEELKQQKAMQKELEKEEKEQEKAAKETEKVPTKPAKKKKSSSENTIPRKDEE